MAHEREHGRVQRRCARRDETTSRADLEKPTINGTKFACPGRCRRKTCGFSTSGDGALDHLEQPAAQPKLHGAATCFHEHLHAAAGAYLLGCLPRPPRRTSRIRVQATKRGAGDEVAMSLKYSSLLTVPSMAVPMRRRHVQEHLRRASNCVRRLAARLFDARSNGSEASSPRNPVAATTP